MNGRIKRRLKICRKCRRFNEYFWGNESIGCACCKWSSSDMVWLFQDGKVYGNTVDQKLIASRRWCSTDVPENCDFYAEHLVVNCNKDDEKKS